jgi:hypothetical protein
LTAGEARLQASHTKLHSNEFERKAPKFLKNRRSPVFQKLAGDGFASAAPIRFLAKADWYQAYPLCCYFIINAGMERFFSL